MWYNDSWEYKDCPVYETSMVERSKASIRSHTSLEVVVQISAPPMHFLVDKTNNGAANNNRAAEARSRQLKRKADN
jgi:hypothetical protein